MLWKLEIASVQLRRRVAIVFPLVLAPGGGAAGGRGDDTRHKRQHKGALVLIPRDPRWLAGCSIMWLRRRGARGGPSPAEEEGPTPRQRMSFARRCRM
jgi:hypothetical protein